MSNYGHRCNSKPFAAIRRAVYRSVGDCAWGDGDWGVEILEWRAGCAERMHPVPSPLVGKGEVEGDRSMPAKVLAVVRQAHHERQRLTTDWDELTRMGALQTQ